MKGVALLVVCAGIVGAIVWWPMLTDHLPSNQRARNEGVPRQVEQQRRDEQERARQAAEQRRQEEQERKKQEQERLAEEKKQEEAKKTEEFEASLFPIAKRHILAAISKASFARADEENKLAIRSADTAYQTDLLGGCSDARFLYKMAEQSIGNAVSYTKAACCNDPDEVKISRLLYSRTFLGLEVTARFSFSYGGMTIKNTVAKMVFDDPMHDGRLVLTAFNIVDTGE